MTGPVNNISSILEVMRRRMAERSDSASARGSGQAQRSETAQPFTAADIQQRLRHRIQSIEADDPRRHSKAVRQFLQVVLQTEFGENLANEVEFRQILDEIQTTMEADPRTRDMLHELVSGFMRA